MAIVDGKKLYNSQLLIAVAAIEDRAASEYAFMMAGTGDDWGRFEANPRVIVGRAYKHRPQVAEADVARWLRIFDEVRVGEKKHGLVRFYTVDGVTYGEWTNYAGDPASQRKYHNCPEPPWSTHEHRRTCQFYGTAKATAGAASSLIRVSGTGTRKDNPEDVPFTGTPKAHITDSSVSPGSSVLPVTDQSDSAPPADEPAADDGAEQGGLPPPPPERAAPDDPLMTPTARRALEREALELVSKICRARDGEDTLDLMARASTGEGFRPAPLPRSARKTNPATMTNAQLEHAVLDLRDLWAEVRPPEVVPAWAPDPAAEEVLGRVLGHLQRTVAPHSYATWLRPWVGVGLEGTSICVRVPNAANADYVQKNYRAQLSDALKAEGLTRISFEFDRPPPGADRGDGRKGGITDQPKAVDTT